MESVGRVTMIAFTVLDQLQANWPEVENKRVLLAVFVVVKFLLVAGIISLLVWSIRRNAAKQCRETERLLDEMEEEDKRLEPSPPTDLESDDHREGWERDPDWWKKLQGPT